MFLILGECDEFCFDFDFGGIGARKLLADFHLLSHEIRHSFHHPFHTLFHSLPHYPVDDVLDLHSHYSLYGGRNS